MSDNYIIQAKNLQKHFDGGEIKALDGVTASVRKGEVVVVIGPSGSGKSTFLRCLNLLELPTGGQVLFEGVDITDKNADINLHRQKMGMVFQHFNLFPHMTILIKLQRQLPRLNIPSSAVQDRAALCPLGSNQYQGPIRCSGNPGCAADPVQWIVVLHLAEVVDDQNRQTVLVGKTLEQRQVVVVTAVADVGGCPYLLQCVDDEIGRAHV